MADEKKKEVAKPAKPAAPTGANKGGGSKAAAGRKSAEKGSKSETAPGPEIKRTAPPRLKTLYGKEVVQRLQKEFGYTNLNQVPKVVKISLNMGLGEAVGNPKVIDSAIEELRLISGQSPVAVSYTHLDVYKRQHRGCYLGILEPVHVIAQENEIPQSHERQDLWSCQGWQHGVFR